MTKLENIIYAKNLILATKEQNDNSFDIIVESLDKQIPKKVSDNDGKWGFCPVCGDTSIEYDEMYCYRCGQALDWSD